MARIVLVHWNAAEARERANRLRAAGYAVTVPPLAEGADLKALASRPPEAFVIDLDRLPSRGRDVALWLRQRRATREVPLVFVGGAAGKVERIRRLLPDATYTDWRRVRGAITAALRRSPGSAARPGALAGYSGTPLPRKLGIKAGAALALLGAPDGFETILGDLPEGVRLRRRAGGSAAVVVLFARSPAELARRFPAADRTLGQGGRLWLAWPKKAGASPSSLTQTEVRRFGLRAGYVDYKIAALDAAWSGLCFARRRA